MYIYIYNRVRDVAKLKKIPNIQKKLEVPGSRAILDKKKNLWWLMFKKKKKKMDLGGWDELFQIIFEF